MQADMLAARRRRADDVRLSLADHLDPLGEGPQVLSTRAEFPVSEFPTSGGGDVAGPFSMLLINMGWAG